ncbi:MAG: endonuclease/exonuclease/phosphatase family protein [Pseudomonadota bacterium]
MRLVTWNVNHRAKARKIPAWIVAAIEQREPDLLVLTEYVEGLEHQDFSSALADIGLAHVACSTRVSGHNQILIAARLPLLPGQVFAPALHDAVPPNFLHVTLPDIGVDCFGVRIPVGSGFDHLKRSLWEWLLDTAASKVDARALLTGDLNTHPGDSHARCGDCLASLQELGWRSGSPVRGASFGGPEGSRKIDHLYVTSSLTVSNSVYDWEWTNAENGWDKVGLPDHAMIVADLS